MKRRISPAAPTIGDIMPDGTVYAGPSSETGLPLYVLPEDPPLTMTWNQAVDYAACLNAHGHRDWRLPTAAELHVLFTRRAAIGGFDRSGIDPQGWYWSSSTAHAFGADFAWGQEFAGGYRYPAHKDFVSAFRCVRTGMGGNARAPRSLAVSNALHQQVITSAGP